MTPSKSPYSIGWSSTLTARRLSAGSYEGPRGTAHDRSTPSISRRRSKWSCRAACLWTTNKRPVPEVAPPNGSGVVSVERFARSPARLSAVSSGDGVMPAFLSSASAQSSTTPLVHCPTILPGPGAAKLLLTSATHRYAGQTDQHRHDFIRPRLGSRAALFIRGIQGERLIQYAAQEVWLSAQTAVHLHQRERDLDPRRHRRRVGGRERSAGGAQRGRPQGAGRKGHGNDRDHRIRPAGQGRSRVSRPGLLPRPQQGRRPRLSVAGRGAPGNRPR